MELTVAPSASALYAQLASRLSTVLREPGLQLGLATGTTMAPLYQAVVKLHGQLRPAASFWMLDEYLGLAVDDPRSYRSFLHQHLLAHFPIDKNQLEFPALERLAPAAAARDYDERLSRAGGLGVQLLGIGMNGHVGLNEPGSLPASRTRVVDIAESTRVSNQHEFGDLALVPTQALTLGLANLLEAKELWLIAVGERKAKIVARALEGRVSTDVPASLLRAHPGLRVFLDAAAASELTASR